MVLQAGSRLLQWSPGFEVVIGSAKNCVQLFHQSSGRYHLRHQLAVLYVKVQASGGATALSACPFFGLLPSAALHCCVHAAAHMDAAVHGSRFLLPFGWP